MSGQVSFCTVLFLSCFSAWVVHTAINEEASEMEPIVCHSLPRLSFRLSR